jgi:ribosomal protein L18E
MDIICISETWLDSLIIDKKVDITGYQFRRKDRTSSRAGGAAMYITHALPHRRALEL